MTSDPLTEEEGEVITPPVDLRKKVRILNKREAAKFDPIKAAEQALERLSQNFPSWMNKECDELASALEKAQETGFNAETTDTLYQSAHNMKGQASTLGYPLVGSVAANLCHLIERIPSPDKLPQALVQQHVEAIRAMVSEEARDMDNETGSALLSRLEEVTDDFLSQFPPKED